MNDTVVITGTGLVSALGLSAIDTWEALMSGECGIKPVEDFDANGFDCNLAAQVSGLDADSLKIHPRDSRIMDKHTYMLIKAARDAFHDSKIGTASVTAEDIGFFAGMGMVDYNIEDLLPSVLKSLNPSGGLDYDAFFSGAFQEIYPLWPLSMLNNISFCQAAIDLEIKGENAVFSPHSDSGMQAIIEAYNSVLNNKATVALAGGVSEKVSPLSMARALLHGILNTSEDPAEQACRPFSSRGKGTILGEGCGILTLELRSTADKRGIPYSAMICGYGRSFGLERGSFSPASTAMAHSMSTALISSGLEPADIDVIIAHGDGTLTGDRNETDAIQRVFADNIENLTVYSSKSALGHLLSGASAVDAILGIYVLKNGIIPSAFNSAPIEKDTGFRLAGSNPFIVHPKKIMINSHSYEGQCGSLIIESAF